MKVLFVSHNANRAGAPIALLQELEVIKTKHPEIEAEVLFLKDGDLKEDFKKLFPVIIYKNNDNSLFYRILRRLKIKRHRNNYLSLCKKGRYNLIYANTVASFDAAINIKKKLGIPLIGHVHEAESLVKEHKITKEQFEEFNKIITVSELALNNLVKNYNIPKENISIQRPFSSWVANYINNNTISGADIFKFKSGEYNIVFMCNSSWQKALDVLPFVMKSFIEKYPQIKCMFYIAGNTSIHHRYHIEYDLKKMNISDKVRWLGLINQPLDLLSRADVFLLLSREESFSLAAEEAAAVGTPIVGFDGATGAGEWIRKGAGILVPYMDFDNLSEALYRLYSDSSLRKAIGKKGKEIVTTLLSEDRKMNTVIEEILKFC